MRLFVFLLVFISVTSCASMQSRVEHNLRAREIAASGEVINALVTQASNSYVLQMLRNRPENIDEYEHAYTVRMRTIRDIANATRAAALVNDGIDTNRNCEVAVTLQSSISRLSSDSILEPLNFSRVALNSLQTTINTLCAGNDGSTINGTD